MKLLKSSDLNFLYFVNRMLWCPAWTLTVIGLKIPERDRYPPQAMYRTVSAPLLLILKCSKNTGWECLLPSTFSLHIRMCACDLTGRGNICAYCHTEMKAFDCFLGREVLQGLNMTWCRFKKEGSAGWLEIKLLSQMMPRLQSSLLPLLVLCSSLYQRGIQGVRRVSISYSYVEIIFGFW